MSKFLVGGDGFDSHATGALATVYPWVNAATANSPAIASGGVFGGNKLSFPSNGAANAPMLSYLFDSTTKMQTQSGSAAGMFSVSFWFVPGSIVTSANPVIAVGNSTGLYNLMGYSNAGNGVLIFPTNINNINDKPVTFNMSDANPVWVTINLSFWGNAIMLATYTINTYRRKTDLQLAWSADALGLSGLLDRVVMYQGSYDYGLDDLIIQTVSSIDSSWPVASGSNPTPENIGILPPRQIKTRGINGNGAVNTWEPSSSLPNFVAASTPGAYVETDSDVSGTDLYTVTSDTNVAGVNGIIMRGKMSGSTGLLQSIQSASGTVGGIANVNTHKGTDGFVAISETSDGTNSWTAAGINAAQFGLKG